MTKRQSRTYTINVSNTDGVEERLIVEAEVRRPTENSPDGRDQVLIYGVFDSTGRTQVHKSESIHEEPGKSRIVVDRWPGIYQAIRAAHAAPGKAE